MPPPKLKLQPPPPKLEKRSLLTLAPLQAPTMNLLIYNIAGNTVDDEQLQLRMRVIAKIIMVDQPDVVGLLEVSAAGYPVLLRLLNPRYIFFQVFLNEKEKTGEVLLCHREKTRIVDGTQPYYYDFNLGRGRILGVELAFQAVERTTHVLLTKLDEKPESTDIRASQFEIVQQVLAPLDHAILFGDFNSQTVDETVEQQLADDEKLTDVWVNLGCPALLRAPNRNKAKRATRIYVSVPELQVTSMALLGTSILKKINVQPADHYGLFATMINKK